jgi:SAM-dependent methyltransferase
MKTKQSMDLFGEALKAYASGDRTKFYFKESSGEISECSLKRYFRNAAQISKSERKLIFLSYGEILDVGCGTGNYMPLLAKRGKVIGIDISKNVIDVAKMKGCNNCRVADIFTFSEKKKFNTITLLGNNIGIGGSVNKTKKLLKKLSSILKDDGQILAIVRRVTGREYFANKLQPMWNNKIGLKFGWIHLNVNFLSDLCRQEGLCLKILQGNQHSYLIKIVKNNTMFR